MFLGEYNANFSGQGRIILPKKFRQELKGKQIILSRGFEQCIFGFAAPDWEKEAARELETPITNREARDLRRYLFSAAEEVELDDQGRIVIPKPLLEYAVLKGGVIIIGAGDHLEIWNLEKWKKYAKNFT